MQQSDRKQRPEAGRRQVAERRQRRRDGRNRERRSQSGRRCDRPRGLRSAGWLWPSRTKANLLGGDTPRLHEGRHEGRGDTESGVEEGKQNQERTHCRVVCSHDLTLRRDSRFCRCACSRIINLRRGRLPILRSRSATFLRSRVGHGRITRNDTRRLPEPDAVAISDGRYGIQTPLFENAFG